MMESIGKINDQYGMSFLKNRIEAASQVLASVSSEKLKNRRYSGLRKILASRFVFIGFGSGRNLTPQEYMLVNLLSEKGADIAFYVLSTDDKSLSEKSIYKVGNEFASRMKARGAGVHDLAVDDPVPELSRLMTPFAYEEIYDGAPTDKVRLSAVSGADNQLGYVFSEIIRLTRDEGYRDVHEPRDQRTPVQPEGQVRARRVAPCDSCSSRPRRVCSCPGTCRRSQQDRLP